MAPHEVDDDHDVQLGPAETPAATPEDVANSALPDTELVLGLVGTLGTDLESLAVTLRSVLTDVFGYRAEVIGLSQLMEDLDWNRELSPTHFDRRLQARMDAGRDLNRAWREHTKSHDALARLALLEIARIRERETEAATDPHRPLERFAYILRSLKRPDEVALMRAVYGDRFVLVGAYAPREIRREVLVSRDEETYGTRDETRWELRLDDLIERDERERGEAGQNVRDTYHRADFFVDIAGRAEQLERCLRVLFGDPFITPSKDEAGMAVADTAARRSGELGRQVGAAITNTFGDVLAVGCNEVPRAFGGQYWPDDDDVLADPINDGREFCRPADTNDLQQAEIAADVVARVKPFLAPEHRDDVASVVEAALSGRLGDITEFGRAVHAEMAAITAAARLGIATGNATLYSTTFPCHNCARHVIGTGIRRLLYIAPYAKSQAGLLHNDSLVVAPTLPHPTDKVVFEPFVGIAPRRYQHLFFGLERKDEEGRVLVFEPKLAAPRLADAEPTEFGLEEFGYLVRETFVRYRLNSFLETASPTLRTEEEKSP